MAYVIVGIDINSDVQVFGDPNTGQPIQQLSKAVNEYERLSLHYPNLKFTYKKLESRYSIQRTKFKPFSLKQVV